MTLPTPGDVRALHEKHAPSRAALAEVLTHCEIVARIALRIAEDRQLPVDTALVEVGALAHDIGVYLVGDGPYIRHGLLGHDLLRDEGWDEELCRFASCHTGVGLTRHDVTTQGLPLPVADYLPRSAEERLVMYADKFHTKSRPPAFLDAAAYAVRVARFGAAKSEAFADLVAEYGEPDLAGLAAAYGQPLERGADLHTL
ncbi:HD domain-containing protein [Kitasatospora camelliae]|uniref:HD domain-containing protein n=1 Tax=Kitasatospora camelliae TaxID=3156397 RepID=A0AAU8K3M3_9ACTN